MTGRPQLRLGANSSYRGGLVSSRPGVRECSTTAAAATARNTTQHNKKSIILRQFELR